MRRPSRWPVRLAAAFNAAAASLCLALVGIAPDEPALLVAGAGLVFFALATAAFALMAYLQGRTPPR